jgi:hypothetical protein
MSQQTHAGHGSPEPVFPEESGDTQNNNSFQFYFIEWKSGKFNPAGFSY